MTKVLKKYLSDVFNENQLLAMRAGVHKFL